MSNEQNDNDGEGEASVKVIDPESFQRLNEVRKELYRGGLIGLIAGSTLGAAAFQVSTYVPVLRKHHTKHTLIASVMLGGAFGSFLFSLVRGQKSVVYIGDVFAINSTPRLSPYMAQLRENERLAAERGGKEKK